MKNQDKGITKMKKEIDAKMNEGQIVDILTYISSLIEIEPSLVKMLKVKEGKGENKGGISGNPHINLSALDLGKKINQIA